ncbi:MAG: hypothetical protein KGS72_22220 [Cyanobacteria bacterium REEB67]|nr:hypothetical protein [Cyanobacteria bacterium REEB67]
MMKRKTILPGRCTVLIVINLFAVLALAGAAAAQSPAGLGAANHLPIVPTDVTNMSLFVGSPLGPVNMPKLNPGNVIKRLKADDFPSVAPAASDDGIIVKADSCCDFARPEPGNIDLSSGRLFVSVRKPARLAFINTPHAIVAVYADAEVLVTFRDGVLKVVNLSGIAERVKVKIHHASVTATINGTSYGEARTEGIVMAVKLGHELSASDRPLSAADLRPADGCPRRRAALFENDCLAVSEFSLEGALNQCELLKQLNNQPRGSREKKIFGDLAKMASVLNYFNGQGGFDGQGRGN